MAIKCGAVCNNGHVRDTKDSAEDLIDAGYCEKCGTELHRSCPNCAYPIPVRRWEREDGTYTKWKKMGYCRNCGNAFPWGPGRVGDFFRKHLSSPSSDTSPRPDGKIFTSPIRTYLNETKYGIEVIKHITDGDKCYRNSLWFPALTMYIHAIEWSAIAYLEAEAYHDVIEKERDGVRYYLASGQHNLIDGLNEHVEVDQKTLSQIAHLNRIERRWVAHHKSGETYKDDVDAVRARLNNLVSTLFEEPALEMETSEGPE